MELDKFIIGMVIGLAVVAAFIGGYVDTLNNYGIAPESTECEFYANEGLQVADDIERSMNGSSQGTLSEATLAAAPFKVGYKGYQTKNLLTNTVVCVSKEYNLADNAGSTYTFPFVTIIVFTLTTSLGFAIWYFVRRG